LHGAQSNLLPQYRKEATMAVYQYIILMSAAPGRLEEFERWYDNEHLRDVGAVRGVLSAKRYTLLSELDAQYEVAQPRWNSLSIYELETDDPVQLAREIRALAGTAAMPMSDSATKKGMLKMVGKLSATYSDIVKLTS
jgi:hypothetical protein